MIFIDSSIWIDFFRGTASPETERLDRWLDLDLVMTGDLVMVEVLQGFAEEADFVRAHRLLNALNPIVVGGVDIAVRAARNYRALRRSGVTIRKTIDVLIATRCIADGHPLLYSDRDFGPFVQRLGLISAMTLP